MTPEPGGVTGDPVDLDRIADALEGAGDRLTERNDHLAAMAETIRALALSTDALVIAVKGNTQRNRQFRWTMFGIALLLLIGVGTAVFFQFRLNGLARSNHTLNKTVLSCVDPTGKCYRDGASRTAAAVGLLEVDIAKATSAAAVCARTDSDYKSVLACVEKATASP